MSHTRHHTRHHTRQHTENHTQNHTRHHGRGLKTLTRALALALAVTGVPAALTASGAGANAAPCATAWGSLPETSDRTSRARLVDVRGGRHACFDRLVINLNRRPTGYHVRYVRRVRQDGSGTVVPVRGGARLRIIVRAPDHTYTGRLTYRPDDRRELVDVSDFRTFRQVAWAGSFEGQSTIGLGVRARLPFRVFTLRGPGDGSRMVVDVAHRW